MPPSDISTGQEAIITSKYQIDHKQLTSIENNALFFQWENIVFIVWQKQKKSIMK